jgi:hypothetical protein
MSTSAAGDGRLMQPSPHRIDLNSRPSRRLDPGELRFRLGRITFDEKLNRQTNLPASPRPYRSAPSLVKRPDPKPNVMVRREGESPSAEPPSGPSIDRSCPRSRKVSPTHIRAAPTVQSRSMAIRSSRVWR